ncbi:MAG TPA: low-specificity L-threonine aldolase [bacterium]|nr:low-specificity L-threonine aldolase [bacterium]
MSIDLRSDTVTLPTPEMREVMARAEVGDDGYGEDPSINRLQEMSAALTGKEDALFVASGTMANLVSIMSHTRPSDSIILGEKAHSWLYESGSPCAVAGVLPIIVGQGGTFTWKDVEDSALGGNVHLAPTTLVMMENTHNAGGGVIFPQPDLEEICRNAKFWGFKTHLDGARIFNAAVATATSVAELVAPADSLSFCLSKGLGCPAGSLVCGDKEFIGRARRYRELLGGGMRQAGILAAAGIYALDHNVGRLQEDHDNARLLAEKLSGLPGLSVDLAKVHTNMVFVEVTKPGRTALDYAGRLKAKGLLVNPMGKSRFRAVTHLGIERRDILKAAEIFAAALSE